MFQSLSYIAKCMGIYIYIVKWNNLAIDILKHRMLKVMFNLFWIQLGKYLLKYSTVQLLAVCGHIS